MRPEEIYLNLIDKERNIYEPAQLFDQCRTPVSEYLQHLRVPGTSDGTLNIKDHEVVCSKTGKKYHVQNQVLDFIEASVPKPEDAEWMRLNKQFLNYHKSLSVYTLLNSVPVLNYLALKSNLSAIKDKTVVDVGAGTGHAFCSFFQYPETIEYYLVDPNLRLLHDQFVRIYPKLTLLPLRHILAFAEALPFKNDFCDMVMSLSAIDHFKDYMAFFSESFRILKPGGTLLLSSHLDIPAQDSDATSTGSKLFSQTFFERVARYLYYKKHKVGNDDHTYHFTGLEPFIQGMEKHGFTIIQSHIFKRYFFIVAQKPK